MRARMLQRGDRVRIRRIVDMDDLDPSGLDPLCVRLRRAVGKVGRVTRIAPDGLKIGESATDPAYVVSVAGVGINVFWREELRRVST